MPLLSETLCILAVIACLRAGALGVDARAFIGQDSEGDLHVNATTGKKVFVSGVNVREEMEALATLVSAQAELLAETRADLAAARQEFSSIKPRENNIVRPREYIYVIGGAFQSESVIVQRFDGGSWSLAPSLTIPRAFASAATYNGFLYAVGGTKFGRAIDAVEEFDGVAWKIVTSLPTPRNSAGAMAYGKGLYVCGGTEVTGHLSKQVHFYNGSVWQTGPSLINWRTFHGMAVYGAFLYAVGGLINPHVPDLNAVERFNGVSWAPVFPLNARRTALGAVVFNGILHAIGGATDWERLTPTRSIDIFDGSSWTLNTTVTFDRVFSGICVFQEQVYAVAGYPSGGVNTTASVVRLNGTTWVPAPSLVHPVAFHATAVY